MTWRRHAAALWGIGGTLALLIEALLRLVPRAIGPLLEGAELTPTQWAAYAGAPLLLAYMEGYRGFQKSFVPRAVARAAAVVDEPLWAKLLSPLYCMALIRARRQRLIVNWCLTLGIIGLIIVVSQMPDPWRAIVDAGVVAGLGWGTLALVVIAGRAWATGAPPDVDLEK
jgi:hypothetical protein